MRWVPRRRVHRAVFHADRELHVNQHPHESREAAIARTMSMIEPSMQRYYTIKTVTRWFRPSIWRYSPQNVARERSKLTKNEQGLIMVPETSLYYKMWMTHAEWFDRTRCATFVMVDLDLRRGTQTSTCFIREEVIDEMTEYMHSYYVNQRAL